MNKKIASEFAVGIIVLIVILIGGIFVMQEKKETIELNYVQSNYLANNDKKEVIKKTDMGGKEIGACQPRYFEGEVVVRGWLMEKNENSDRLNVKIKKEDIEKLPSTEADLRNNYYYATLIDPTDEVKKNLSEASEENPTDITIRGFAQVCKEAPEVSLKQATVAFGKNNI